MSETQSRIGVLWVHDYGEWHIIPSPGNWSTPALCGATPQRSWRSQMHWHEPKGLTIDERAICAGCLLENQP